MSDEHTVYEIVTFSNLQICIYNQIRMCVCACVCVLQGMYFDRDDVALPNFSSFFLERSVKEREQAGSLLEYQNMRGGRVIFQTIAVCVCHSFV